MAGTDPAALEVMKNSLFSVAEEMGAVLVRAAYSTNIKDRRDCSCAIYTGLGELAAQAEHIPLHLGIMPSAIRALLGYCEENAIEMAPGDAFLYNDPFLTGSHAWDLMVASPVFHGGEIAAIVGNLAHHPDIGEHKAHVGSEALDEGVRIPPVKIEKEGELDREILRLVLHNVRVEEVERDIRAQLGANRRGAARMAELIRDSGSERVLRYMDELIDYSERRLRAAISQLPRKRSSFEDFIEGDGISDDLIKIRVTVSVEGSDIRFDFSGTDPQVEGPLNSPLPVTMACAGYCVKCLTDPEVPSNEGVYRPIQIDAPEGSLVNASFPAAVAYANSVTCMRIVDAILGAFARIVPDRVCAASTGTMNALNIKGVDPRTGGYYGYVETYAGGWGAMRGMDGLDATHTHMTNTMNASVEAIEMAYPLRVIRYGIVRDSEGAGEMRGGVGVTREIEAVGHTATLGGRGDRARIRPWGLEGGGEASGSRYLKIRRDGSQEELPSKFQGILLETGERIVIETAGGGGWGDPKKRDPERVRRDCEKGVISLERARKEYGVAIKVDSFEIDRDKTRRARKGSRARGG
ncbi:MAG: hydantoinase B/oxoprolinase family protein [Candidatus Bathyarchaeota archaeon]|nr:hydantoinase B/oxoprolinase family protein [Candidatus Bathyarchaeota archaeon]